MHIFINLLRFLPSTSLYLQTLLQELQAKNIKQLIAYCKQDIIVR
jgi:hypothetical protein